MHSADENPSETADPERNSAESNSRDTTGRFDLLLTAGEYETQRAQLDKLREIRERDLPELLREARSFVDSDAAEEIAQIHEDQAVVDARIRSLQQLLRNARVVDSVTTPEVISLGHAVRVRYLASGRIATYRVTGVSTSVGHDVVSAGSPVGRALLGRAPGETVVVELPRGRVERLAILGVSPAEPATA